MKKIGGIRRMLLLISFPFRLKKQVNSSHYPGANPIKVFTAVIYQFLQWNSAL
jgi:hypothetical protein